MVWALRGVHLDEVIRQIRGARPWPIVASIIVATLTFPLRLVRWRLLLRRDDGGPLPVLPVWHAVAIGFMANNILPFRAGELVLLAGEPVPERGRLKLPDTPGFGVELDPTSTLDRPFTH